jgi:putative copper export protein
LEKTLDIVLRFLHILAAAWVVGSLVYTCYVLSPSVQAMAADERTRLLGRISARLRPLAVTAIVLLLVTGLYNFVRINEAGVVVPAYHIAFGIKFLLALHVFGMLFVLSKPPGADPRQDAKRSRLALGAMISAVIIVALGAYLRTLHL